MTRLTRYFLKEFLRPLLFSTGALLILVLVSELMERMDKFIAGKATVGLVAKYLFCLLPMRGLEVLPVATLLATLFSLGNLARRQEITAAMAGGVHPWTCVRLILVAGALLSAASLGVSEYLVPISNREAKHLWKMDIRHYASLRQTKFENLTVAGEGGMFYSIGQLDADEKRLESVTVERFDGGRPAWQASARFGGWTKDGWLFRDGVERTYAADGTVAAQTPFAEKLFPLKDTTDDLIPQESDAEEMNYKQFNRHLRRLRVLGVPTRKQEVELHLKLAFPWTSFIVLLLGIPFAFQKTGGKVKAIGFALGVAFFYFGLMEVGRALGQKPWCPPLLGAWLANLVFITLGLFLFRKMKELS